MIGPQSGPAAFIFHHTGGRGTVQGVQDTLRQRGLGVQYVMDRDGNITQIGGAGSQHMRPGSGVGAGLSNGNTVGMEVIAKNNGDVTPQQVAAAQKFIAANYPNLPVYGHGEVNPGHKEADEGLAIVNAIRQGRGQPIQPQPFSAIAPVPGSNNPLAAIPQQQAPNLPLFSPQQSAPSGSPVTPMPQSVWDQAFAMSQPGPTPAQSIWSMLAPASPQAPSGLGWLNPNYQNTLTG